MISVKIPANDSYIRNSDKSSKKFIICFNINLISNKLLLLRSLVAEI